MILKIEGKGNGIMTNITNLDKVAEALRVPPMYPLKFFGVELGTLIKQKTDSFIVNGKHDQSSLEKLLDKFIDKYILCPICKIPEMTLKAKKETLIGSCRSCGKRHKLDTTHKVATYILKNPPKDDSEFADNKDKKAKPGAKGKEESAKPKLPKDSKKETEKDKKDSEKEPTLSKEEKHKKEPKSASAEPKLEQLNLSSPEISDSINRIKEFKNSGKKTAAELVDQISNIVISQQMKEDLKYYVAVHGLFDEKFLVQWAQDSASKDALKSLVEKDMKGKYWILIAFEYFIMKTHAANLIPHANTILKCLYDYGLVEEDTIIDCYGAEKDNKTYASAKIYNKEQTAQFKKNIDAFVKWLKEAEEGSEEEEEEVKTKETTNKEDEYVKRQKELIEEQKKQQESKMAELKSQEKIEEQKVADPNAPKPLNILEIKADEKAATLDDL